MLDARILRGDFALNAYSGKKIHQMCDFLDYQFYNAASLIDTIGMVTNYVF